MLILIHSKYEGLDGTNPIADEQIILFFVIQVIN